MPVERIEINVQTPGIRWPGDAGSLQVKVSGLSDESFIKAVERSERDSVGQDAKLWDLCGVEWDDPDYPVRLHQIAPEGLSMAQAQEFFGDESTAWPPTIRVTEGGYGGGGEVLLYVIELARTGLEIGGAVGATLAAQRAIMRVHFGKVRRLAKEWNDTSNVSQELADAVYNGSPWQRSDFDKTFALGDSRGPELLRRLGFERQTYPWGGEEWRYDFDAEDRRAP